METEEFKKQLESEYLLVRKGRWWSFLGGAVAFLVAAGVISYQASLKAIETPGIQTTIQQINNMKQSAEGAKNEAERIVSDLKKLANFSRSGHFIGNYKTHWNDEYIKVIVPVFFGSDRYKVDISNMKIWNESRALLTEKGRGDGFITNGNYFIYKVHFPDPPRPKEVEIEFDWKITPID